jgi:acetyl esterase/lipase
VVVHGGFWRVKYDSGLGRPLAADLAARGWVAWTIEYRRVGGPGADAGGWPATFEDVAAAVDLLPRALDAEPGPVVVLGHSAGGHLGAWAAARHTLPAGAPGADPAVACAGVVAQSGVLDLRLADRLGLGGGAVRALLGAAAGSADVWSLADPAARLPTGVPLVAVQAEQDQDVPAEVARSYVQAAANAGDDARMAMVPGDHYALISPGTAAWEACVAAVGRLAAP